MLEAADRDDAHAVLSAVGAIPDAGQHHLE